jgi:amino acid transporter
MLRRQPFHGGYLDWPPPSLAEVRARWLWWLCLAVASVGVLALVAFVLSHDDPRQPGLSDRGWGTLAAAALLLVLLSIHHRHGAGRLVRAIAEYAVVALLAVLLTITALPAADQPAGKQSAAKQPAGKQAGTAAKVGGDGCPPVKQVHAWLACLWRQANPPDPKPTKGHAMPLSPAPLSTWRTP